MNVRLQDLRLQPHISVSQLACYTRCPRQFFFRYIEGEPPAFRSVALAFGSAWHEAVGHVLMNGTPHDLVPLDEMHDVFCYSLDQQLAADGPPVLFEDEEDEDALKVAARGMLEVFVEKFPFPDQVLGVEIPFSVDLHDPVTGRLLPVPLIGAVDAIVKYGDDVTLVELKTGKRRWGQDQLELDAQLTAYRMGCRALGIDDPRLRLAVSTKGRKPDVQIEDLVRHERDERELIELAVGVLRAADAGIDVRVRGWMCKTCGYQAACSP